MSDLPLTDKREIKNSDLRSNIRIFDGILMGIIAGILLISAIDRGAFFYSFFFRC